MDISSIAQSMMRHQRRIIVENLEYILELFMNLESGGVIGQTGEDITSDFVFCDGIQCSHCFLEENSKMFGEYINADDIRGLCNMIRSLNDSIEADESFIKVVGLLYIIRDRLLQLDLGEERNLPGVKECV